MRLANVYFIFLVLGLCSVFQIESVCGQSASGAQAIQFLGQQAERRAQAVRSPTEFAESNMDEFRFYHTFVSYRGASFLPHRLLGSWEFADRIENLHPYWSPVDERGIELVRSIARSAREHTGVIYNKPVLTPVAWLDELASGKKVEVSEIGEVLMPLAEVISARGYRISIEHTVGWHAYDEEVGGSVWHTERQVTEGLFIPRGKIVQDLFTGPIDRSGTIYLTNFETRLNEKNAAIKRKSTEDSPVVGFGLSDISTLRVVDANRNLRRTLLSNLKAKGFSMAKMMELAPRELGVNPNSCEGGLRRSHLTSTK